MARIVERKTARLNRAAPAPDSRIPLEEDAVFSRMVSRAQTRWARSYHNRFGVRAFRCFASFSASAESMRDSIRSTVDAQEV